MKKQLNIKKLILLNLPYILMGLFSTNFGEAWRMAVGADASAKMLSFFSTLPVALASWWPSLHPLDLLVGLCCCGGLRLAVYLKSKNAKKYRHGMEYGSARWGTHEDIAPYIDPVFQNNVILTKTESLTMNSRPKDPKTARNKNVLVIGGSGSGKTRFWLKPNLMQMHSSYVVTDPKGTILVECGKMLQRGTPKLGKDGKPMKDKHGKVIYEPYRIKVLNTINFKKSMHYNPFAYTRTLYVLANTVQQKDWDGRFSPANKTWAKTVDIPPNPDSFGGERSLDFVVNSDTGLVDLFLTQARQDYLRLQPLTPEEIQAEAARLLQELRAPDPPNSPHGTHYMARVSPDFLARAGTQAHDQLMKLLPFRSLAITGLVDRPGTYVTILASEDRSKELRQPRRSVRRQLKQEPHPAEKPEKKAPARKKQEPER